MLLFTDSFDDRPIGSIGDRYTASGGSHVYNISAGSAVGVGRTGNGLYLSTGILDVFDNVTFQLAESRQTLYVGVARNAHISTALCSIRLNGSPHIYAQLNSDNTVSVIRFGSPEVVLATSTQTIPASGFYYVELMGKIDPSAGAYELRIDGTRWLSASGVNTSSTGESLANQVRLTYNHSGLDGSVTCVDDFYIADDDADDGNAAIVGFAGPVKIALLEETGNGASTEWTPLSGANYTNVDETTGKDDDTSYVATLTEGDVDLYTVSAFEAVLPTVKAVAVHQWMKKMDGIERNVTPVAYVSGAEYPGNETALGITYGRVFYAFERNPATELPWTRAEVTAAQFGVALAE